MSKLGIKEFRDQFTTLAREATAPVIVTNHGKVVGWFIPAQRDPVSVEQELAALREFRAALQTEGRDPDAILRELGIREDPWDDPRLVGRKGDEPDDMP